jgi:two-component system CheB/CheR fusion protein
MSHEIRTPMNAIIGFSQLIEKHYKNKQKVDQFIEIITHRSYDLLDIINELLDISKIEAGQVSVHPQPLDLNSLFKELGMIFEEQKKRYHKDKITFKISSQFGAVGSIITIDAGKLKQIFINLLSNALKFTEKGIIELGCKPDVNG